MRHRHLPPLCRWLGVLMLLLRVLGPAQPTLDGSGPSTLAALFPDGLPICHAPTEGKAPFQPGQQPGHACELCLACHATGHAPLLPAEPVLLRAGDTNALVIRAVLPPATGPPARPRRRSTPPIGPPRLSV